jgi:enamine deaminase RidA (YjgF/YER057c/UK114 family)
MGTGELMEILQPSDWAQPRGYSNGVVASGRIVFIAGQIGWNSQQQFEALDFVGQSRQALANILAVLAEAGGEAQHITRLVWYVVDKHEYMNAGKELGAIYRELMGKHYPAMTAVQVVALMEDKARVEIEAVAVIP